jgi:hypothetical protein
MTITPPVPSHSASHLSVSHPMHFMRIVLAIVAAIALELATFATVSTLITGR